MTRTKKIVILGIFISQALVLSLLERLIPVPVPIPGIKLGLANIMSLFTIIIFGWREALIVVLLRTFLGSVFGGGISAFLYSAAGGVLSTLAMALLYKRGRQLFSIPAISVVGAVFHNIGQLTVASLVVANPRLFYYLPVLTISAVVTGIFTGLAVQACMRPLDHMIRVEERYRD